MNAKFIGAWFDAYVLKPMFDIYDFGEEHNIDIDDEGYDPISKAEAWFKELPIPSKYAELITELIIDGGNEVYGQIYPFWDGEDDYFDLKQINDAELEQFENLKKIITVVPLPSGVKQKLEAHQIEVEED